MTTSTKEFLCWLPDHDQDRDDATTVILVGNKTPADAAVAHPEELVSSPDWECLIGEDVLVSVEDPDGVVTEVCCATEATVNVWVVDDADDGASEVSQ